MGLFGFFAHWSTKNRIRKTIELYNNMSSDHRAGMIFYIWLFRGVNLPDFRGNPEIFLPVYYYARGAEVAILDLIEKTEKYQNIPLTHAAYHHFYTNLAVSYPDEGYGKLVRELWSVVFEDYTNLEEIISEMEHICNNTNNQRVIESNDVPVEELIKGPSKIIPHFLVPGHPLSAWLLEEEKLGNHVRGE